MPTSKRPAPHTSTALPGRFEEVAFYVPPVVPDLLPNEPNSLPNLLPFKAVFLPLRVEFAQWGNSDPTEEDPETLTLYWDGREVRTLTWTAPVPPDELFIEVPVGFLSEGQHWLHYQIKLFNGMRTDSEALEINIDKTPPLLADDDALMFPSEVIDNGVTDRYLKQHGELTAQVPLYLGADVGDTVSWYWSDSPVGKQLVDRLTLTKGDVDKPLDIKIPADFIIQLGDGLRYARYEVQDRAGTALQRSLAVALHAAVTPPPRQLPPPFVRQARGSDYFSELLPTDAETGATLAIPDSAVLEPDDQVTVFWGEPGSPGAYQADTPIDPGSREYAIPAKYVAMNLNSRIPLHYQVKAYDDMEHNSSPHQLTIGRLHGLPLIHSDAIRDNQLNLAKLGAQAAFSLRGWQFMDAGQFITVYIEGVKRGAIDQKITLPVVTDMAVPGAALELAVGSVTKNALQALELDYQFYVRVKVSFDDKRTWVEFPMITPTLIDQP
ncbi:hypothetical protein JET66_19720 [Pseudomonas putida]|uniref:hypothetical protein n=1 Tax=Pseudomonas putida TaxID=303 RepID=UPI0018E664ED|nr:hypothetical protein [Pseudomonas putida]MBI6926872.1 hypothetical protein [Pseudomonas putida]